jgi:hypothetical protein
MVAVLGRPAEVIMRVFVKDGILRLIPANIDVRE